MSKFIKCYEADGLMWCTFPSGKIAKPFPARFHKAYKKEKTLPKKASILV